MTLTKEPRKIIQVSHIERYNSEYVIALCNDGTVWEIWGKDGVWYKYKDIPQD